MKEKMGGVMALCSSNEEDVFTQHTKKRTIDNSYGAHAHVDFNSNSTSASAHSHKLPIIIMDHRSSTHKSKQDCLDNNESARGEKIRVLRSSKILIFGDNRIKVATACYLHAYIQIKQLSKEVEVVVGTRDPCAAKNAALVRAGIRLVTADSSVPETLLPAIRESGADTVFIVCPSQPDRAVQTISGISACKRAGVGHVVVLSQTCIESNTCSVFREQCTQIENFIKQSRLSYTIVRLPILMDNYLSQLQSMAEYGIFYRPISPHCKRNAITISDVGTAVGNILLTPGNILF